VPEQNDAQSVDTSPDHVAGRDKRSVLVAIPQQGRLKEMRRPIHPFCGAVPDGGIHVARRDRND